MTIALGKSGIQQGEKEWLGPDFKISTIPYEKVWMWNGLDMITLASVWTTVQSWWEREVGKTVSEEAIAVVKDTLVRAWNQEERKDSLERGFCSGSWLDERCVCPGRFLHYSSNCVLVYPMEPTWGLQCLAHAGHAINTITIYWIMNGQTRSEGSGNR